MNFALCPLTSFEGIIGTISRADSFFSVCLIMGLWMNLNELTNKCGPSRMVMFANNANLLSNWFACQFVKEKEMFLYEIFVAK